MLAPLPLPKGEDKVRDFFFVAMPRALDRARGYASLTYAFSAPFGPGSPPDLGATAKNPRPRMIHRWLVAQRRVGAKE